MNKLNEIDLVLNKYWNSSKINQGDSILLHANASRLVKNCLKIDKNFHTNSILKTLLAKIGPTGTIIVPTFSFKSINYVKFSVFYNFSSMILVHKCFFLEIKLDKKKFIDNLVNKIQSITKNSPLKEVKNNLRSVIQSKLDEFDLVSREEFEVQKEVLRKTREKLENLEKKIEKKIK